MIRLEEILDRVEKHHPGDNLDLIRRAYIFSAKEHKGQVRASGEPYLTHPLEVANLLAEMKMDAVTVSVGLLHDVVEDTLTTLEKIEELFGPEVAHIVDGVTKISQIPFTSKEEKQAENFRKMLLAMTDDIRVIMVKFADRLHNMRTLAYLTTDRREPSRAKPWISMRRWRTASAWAKSAANWKIWRSVISIPKPIKS